MKRKINSAALVLAALVCLPAAGLSTGDPARGNEMAAQAVLESPEDRTLSPYTGYTRAHWIEIAQKIIAGILPYFDERSGMPELVGDPSETGHFAHLFDTGGSKEAFDRSLTLVAFYTAATGSDRVPGYDGSITGPYISEIRRGTDKSGPHYWGDHPRYDVFGTNLAMGILVSPEFFWEPFSEREKSNILAYFKDLAHTLAYDCNHWHFHQITVPLLDRHGVESNREFLTSMFQRLMNWYRGDGWFIDGGNRSFDNYNLWAFQLFNHALIRFDPGWKEQFGDFIEKTTAEFLDSYPYLFGRDGGPVPWGRSTTYRFACLAPVGWTVINGYCTLPPGQARRLASGGLRYFWEHGALSERGLLEPGYRGPNTAVAEPYIDRGAPYWAVQGMSALLIPEDHPFWTAKEEPLPADKAGGRVALPGAQMLLKVSPVDGEARLYPVGQPFSHWGQWQRGIKYCQLAYSSYLGWCVTGEGGPDLGAGRTGISFDGRHWRYRERPEVVRVSRDHLVSREKIPEVNAEELDTVMYDFGEVITHTLVGNSGEVHVFWHNCGTPLYMHLGGYGISVPHGGRLKVDREGSSLAIHSDRFHSAMRVIHAPEGAFGHELIEPREGWKHSHNLGGRGAWLYWRSVSPVRAHTPVVIHVEGARDREPPAADVEVSREGETLTVLFEGKTCEINLPLEQK